MVGFGGVTKVGFGPDALLLPFFLFLFSMSMHLFSYADNFYLFLFLCIDARVPNDDKK